MTAKSKKAQTRSRQNQAAEIKKLQRRMAVGKLLDVGTKGSLLIDDFVDDYGKGQRCFLHSEVERLAKKAVERTARLVEGLPRRRQDAKRVLEALARVDEATRWLRASDAIDLALAFDAKAVASPSAAQPLSRIIDAVKHLQDWHELLLAHFEPPVAAPGGQILAQMFVAEMSEFHRRVALEGKKPAKETVVKRPVAKSGHRSA
jgi:hypothetical protein